MQYSNIGMWVYKDSQGHTMTTKDIVDTLNAYEDKVAELNERLDILYGIAEKHGSAFGVSGGMVQIKTDTWKGIIGELNAWKGSLSDKKGKGGKGGTQDIRVSNHGISKKGRWESLIAHNGGNKAKSD